MQIARKGEFVMLRLDHGEDVLECTQKAVEKERSTLVITTGLGMISDFELGYFDMGNYIRRSFKEPHELLSMQGSVASEGENRVHLHVSVADRKHNSFGGHLLSGKAWMSNEIAMVRLEGVPSVRDIDPERKVGVLRFRG